MKLCHYVSAHTILLASELSQGPYRSYANMAADNQHKLNFINQRNEPYHEKEHVKISKTAKFQSCRPDTRRMVKKNENKRQMYDSQAWVNILNGFSNPSTVPVVGKKRGWDRVGERVM